MCGILGTYDIAVDAGRWAAMSDALAHCGPDAAGTWTGPDDAERVRLGHRRLSIIDPSAAANQPLVKDGMVLVFGGEIYNYRRLRADLGGAGISFRTSSDTEVPLEAWRRWGPASLRRLRGMSPSRCSTSARTRSPWPTTSSASGRCSGRRGTAAWPSLRRSRGCGRCLGSARRSITRPSWPAVLLDPRGPLRTPGRPQAPTGELAGGRPGRPPAAGAVLRPPGRARRAVRAAGRRGGAAPPARGLGRRAPGGRRAHLHLPVRRAGLQPAHRPGRPPQPRHRLLHDLVPAGGPAPGGHARRPGLRPQAGRRARHQAGRGRDRPRRGRPAPGAWCRCWMSRSAMPPPSTPISSAGPPGTPGSRCCCPAWTPTSCSPATASTTPGCSPPATAACPASCATGSSRRRSSGCRWPAGVAATVRRAGPSASWPSRTCPRRRRSAAATPTTTVGEQHELLDPELWPQVDQLVEEHAAVYDEGPADDQVNRMYYTDTRLFLTGLNLAYTDRASMAASTEVRVPYVNEEVAAAAFAIRAAP